jgi:hypothetical protein
LLGCTEFLQKYWKRVKSMERRDESNRGKEKPCRSAVVPSCPDSPPRLFDNHPHHIVSQIHLRCKKLSQS